MYSLLFLFFGCTNNDIIEEFDCANSTLNVSLLSKTNVSGCASSDGKIEVSATSGQAPYEFRINGGAFSTSGSFSNLAPGTYTVESKDANGCLATLSPAPTIQNPTSTLNAVVQISPDTNCTTDNGEITIVATGGTPPYSYKFGTSNFTAASTATSLSSGAITVIIKDATECTFTVAATVQRGDTGISWSGEIQNIITTNCAVSGCHVGGGVSPNLTNFNGVQNSANSVKSRTANGSMPPASRADLTADQIRKIGCWVDDGAKNN